MFALLMYLPLLSLERRADRLSTGGGCLDVDVVISFISLTYDKYIIWRPKFYLCRSTYIGRYLTYLPLSRYYLFLSMYLSYFLLLEISRERKKSLSRD